MHLVLAMSFNEWAIVIPQVALGLGMVIFVHELGHFAVAKMCGVKCDKFFVGFDIGGYKISRKWGETEYGIGILPLGGYVKMMGQDDNPANMAEQMKESQANPEDETIKTKEIIGPDGNRYVVDNRSYLAKSVPQRMAIISAGVIMNIIFAFVFAVIAFGVGVPYTPCIVTGTSPGSAAYQAAIRPGDEILAIDELNKPTFSDLMSGVTLGDMENGIPFTVKRALSGETEEVLLKPKKTEGEKFAKVGIFIPPSLRMAKQRPVDKNSIASTVKQEFQGEDEIIAVNGEPVSQYSEYTSMLVKNMGKPIELKVQRGGTPPKDNRFGRREGGEEVTISVPAQPLKRMGLVMEMGKIVAVEKDSPAAVQGLQAGDFIEKVSNVEPSSIESSSDQKFQDPIALPDQLRRLADESGEIRLTVRRASANDDGRLSTEELDIPLRKVDWLEVPRIANEPLSIPALGLAYRVLNRVDSALPGSPAAKAGLQRGDVILKAELIYPDKDEKETISIEFTGKGQNSWPFLIQRIQDLPADAKIKLTFKRGKEEQVAEVIPQEVPGEFIASRGFVFQPVKRIRIAESFNEQVYLGWKETTRSLGMVLRFLSKLGTQVPLTSLGGPFTIAKVAGYSAFEGVGKLLVFLTMLSANLAVINFLPIPLLDGGHMVFLTWEGIRGRPASERVIMAMQSAGFVFVILLMLFVITLDIGRLIGLG